MKCPPLPQSHLFVKGFYSYALGLELLVLKDLIVFSGPFILSWLIEFNYRVFFFFFFFFVDNHGYYPVTRSKNCPNIIVNKLVAGGDCLL